MSAPSSTIEQLPPNIPRLEPNGVNWAVFSMRFQEAMQATRRWSYFDGSKLCPVPADKANPTDAETEAIDKWDYEDQIARYLLSQRLPDTTTMQVSHFKTVKERWEKVTEEFTAKSVYAKNDLEHVFLLMRCPKGGDVRVFLTSLTYKREELAAAGVTISDKDYERTVLKGIPDELARYAAHLLGSARLTDPNAVVDTNMLIGHICEEAERIKNHRTGSQPNQGGKKDGQSDKALAAIGLEGGNKKGRRKGKCHNCGKPGHWARECRSKKKEEGASGQAAGSSSSGTDSKPETKPVGSANIVDADAIGGDGFWMAEEVAPAQVMSAELDTLLEELDDSEEVVCAQTKGTELYLHWCSPDDWLHDDWADPLFEEEMACAVITPAEDDGAPRTELYDSGATRHISPYQSDFTSYTPLSPPLPEHCQPATLPRCRDRNSDYPGAKQGYRVRACTARCAAYAVRHLHPCVPWIARHGGLPFPHWGQTPRD